MSREKVSEVFEFWRSILSNARSQLDDKRRRAIASRLHDGYTVDDLKLACLGCKASAFHNGQNDRRKRYVSIELICRDSDHVDEFIGIAEQEAGKQRSSERDTSQDAEQRASVAAGPSEDTRRMLDALKRRFGLPVHH